MLEKPTVNCGWGDSLVDIWRSACNKCWYKFAASDINGLQYFEYTLINSYFAQPPELFNYEYYRMSLRLDSFAIRQLFHTLHFHRLRNSSNPFPTWPANPSESMPWHWRPNWFPSISLSACLKCGRITINCGRCATLLGQKENNHGLAPTIWVTLSNVQKCPSSSPTVRGHLLS